MTEPSDQAVEAQLERIVTSPEFVARPKLVQFLSFVVDQKLKGRSDKITQYTIAVQALGYGGKFDPVTNPTVRILARRLRRALEQYYNNHGAADPIWIEIPKGGYIPVCANNPGITETVSGSELASPVPVQRLRQFTEPAIAVFEFKNLSDQRNGSLIAIGLNSELLVALTRFSGLTVLGPLTHQSDGHPIELHQINSEYGARFALKGWVRTDGTRVRITADLMDTSTGYNQWGRTFEYDLDKTSLFEIEDEVTSRIAGALADDLGVIFRKLRSESYEDHIKLSDITFAILAYNNAWMTQAPEDWETANGAVSQALTNHPEQALLLALQSNIYYGEVLYGLNLVPDAISKMEELATKAVSLDPDLQIAQYNLVVQNAFFGRTKQCAEVARRVVDMNPNHPRILAGCAVAVTSVGDYDVGRELIERAKSLNPHYPGWYFFVNYLVNFFKRRYEQAWGNAQLIHVEGLLWHPLVRAAVLGKLGRTEEAKPFIDELLQIKVDFRQRPREYIKPLFVTDDHVDMIMDGLVKAGI